MVMYIVPSSNADTHRPRFSEDDGEAAWSSAMESFSRSPTPSGRTHPTQEIFLDSYQNNSNGKGFSAAQREASSDDMPDHNSDDVEWKGTVLVGTGVASVVRIPIPGTKGLCLQLNAPGGYKGATSTLFFVEDPKQKSGRMLRLDYGPRPETINGQKVTVIDYHWNQKGTFSEFGIADHTPAAPAGRYLYTAAKYFKYGGRLMLVLGVGFDLVSIVKANKPLKRASEVVAGWAGAWLGCKVVGAGGGYVGGIAGTEFPIVGNAVGAAIGTFSGCIVGGLGGYFASSDIAGAAYDWAEDTSFAPLMQASENEVYQWMREHGL